MNMKPMGVFLGVLFGITLLGALAAGGYFAIKVGLDLFGTLEPQVATLTAIASVVVLLCATIIAGGSRWSARKEAEVQARADKSNLYERIVLIWGEKLNTGTEAMDQDTEAELQKLERLLTLRGGSKVIKTYVELQVQENNAGLHSPEMPSQVAKLLLEMRQDIGQDALNLNQSDLMNLLNVKASRNTRTSPFHVGRPQVSLTP
jgi:hypothetical protein